jgi:hypothetical protein
VRAAGVLAKGRMFDMPALERLGRHRTFKFQALWSIRDGIGLMVYKANLDVCSEIHAKYSMQSDHYVEILNFKPGGT